MALGRQWFSEQQSQKAAVDPDKINIKNFFDQIKNRSCQSLKTLNFSCYTTDNISPHLD